MAEKRRAEAARKATKSMRELLQGYRSLMELASRAEALTLPQLRLLHAASGHKDDSAAALARLCQVTPQTLQAMLTRAAREGWVVRGTSDRSQRIITARLTAKGRAVLRRGRAMAQNIEERLWEGVSLTSLNTINSALERGAANLRAELQRESEEHAGNRRAGRSSGIRGSAPAAHSRPAQSRPLQKPAAHLPPLQSRQMSSSRS